DTQGLFLRKTIVCRVELGIAPELSVVEIRRRLPIIPKSRTDDQPLAKQLLMDSDFRRVRVAAEIIMTVTVGHFHACSDWRQVMCPLHEDELLKTLIRSRIRQ